MSGELGRLSTVTWLSFRGSLQGARTVGLAAFGLIPSVIVGAVAASHPSSATLSDAAEGLFALLTLPIIAMVIVLVLSVGQFRNEIDAETLVYLSDRSVARSTLVVGKYLGSFTAALAFVLPAALLPLAIAELGGGSGYASAVPVAVGAAAVLATAVYGGVFLLLGLATRSALLIGLLFGFLWEELLPALPGEVPRFTVIYYLRSFLSGALPTGPLAGYPGAISLPISIGVPIGLVAVFLVLASVLFRYVETAPERESV